MNDTIDTSLDSSPDLADSNTPRSRRTAATFWWRMSAYVGLVIVSILSVHQGLALRSWVWESTAEIRFRGDISNAVRWGNFVLEQARMAAGMEARSRDPLTWGQFFVGYLNTYDAVARRDDVRGLDYSPARLLIMSAWVKHVVDQRGRFRVYQDQFAGPLLMFNTVMGLVASILMGVLVWQRMRRSQVDSLLSVSTGVLAGLLLWFSPAVLINAHAWPQWDLWVLPFFIAAVLAASSRWWLTAGLMLSLGAMFKGQILMVAPLLALWPLFMGRFQAVLRVIIGFFFGVAVCCAVWLVPTVQAWTWLVGLTLLAGVFSLMQKGQAARSKGQEEPNNDTQSRLSSSTWASYLLSLVPSRQWPYGLAVAVATLTISWPWLNAEHVEWIWTGLALVAGIILLPWWLPARWMAPFIIAVFTLGVFVASGLFGGSWNWLTYGFPTDKFKTLAMGPISNFPAILQQHYQWGWQDTVFTVRGVDVSIRQLLAGSYGLALVLCAMGAAVFDRRDDRRLLIAVTAPWVLMFALMPQMHERYLFWGACLGVSMIAVSVGMTLVHLLTLVIACGMMWFQMQVSANKPEFTPTIFAMWNPTRPGIGWAMLLLALIFLFQSLAWGKRALGRDEGKTNETDVGG